MPQGATLLQCWRQCYIIVLQHFSLYFHKIKKDRTEKNMILWSKIRFYREKYKNTEKNIHFTILGLFYNIAVKCIQKGCTILRFFFNSDQFTHPSVGCINLFAWLAPSVRVNIIKARIFNFTPAYVLIMMAAKKWML